MNTSRYGNFLAFKLADVFIDVLSSVDNIGSTY